MVRLLLLCAAAAAASSCGGPSTAPSAEENRELDRAAEMLDGAPDALNEVDDAGLAANGADEPRETPTKPREGSR
jgi:hypothetical protein